MKRAIRAAAWLYPERWRKRYGGELEALIEDARGDWRFLVDVVKGAVIMQFSRWGLGRLAAVTMLAGTAIAAVIAHRIPNQYESRATLRFAAMHRVGRGQFMPEADPVTNQHQGEMTVRRLIGSVESFENLSQIINDLDLYGERWSAPSAEVIERMKRAIVVEPSPDHDPTFKLRFEYPNRYIAQRVTQELVSRIIEANLHRLAIAEVDSGSSIQMQILDPPTLAKFPSGPSRLKITGGGLLAGLLAGVLLSLAVPRMTRAAS
jgi:uncharacterized protein involved in exopolysaccharide biosynthesis